MKRQVTDLQKIFANFISDKALDVEYVKNSQHSTVKTETIQFENEQKT